MRNGSDKFNNEHGFEFLSYIYGELDEAGRDAFESHLTSCDECVMELASYSDARLGVIEWRREDFDHLETPAIVVPWLSEKQVIAEAGPVGTFTRFIEALASFPRFAKAGIGFAAAAMAIGVFYFAASSPVVKPDVAGITNNDQPSSQVPDRSEMHSEPKFTASSKTGVEPINTKNTAKRPEHVRPALAVRSTNQQMPRRTEIASTVTNKMVPTATKKAPRLTTAEEEEDKSLRLADLFAEIGSSEE
jgi:hypothetical protein